MDLSQEIKIRMKRRLKTKYRLFISMLICFVWLPLQSGEDSDRRAGELREILPTLKREEISSFIDEIWSLQDYRLMGYVIENSDRYLRESFKVKFTKDVLNIYHNPDKQNIFMDKVVILALRALDDLWEENPPAIMSGSQDFAMYSAAFAHLKRGLKAGGELEFSDVLDSEKRKILADDFEKELGLSLPTSFSEKDRDTKRGARGVIATAIEKEDSSPSVIIEEKQLETNHLKWFILGVLLVSVITAFSVMARIRSRL